MAGEFGPFVLLGEPETLLHEEIGPDKISNDANGVFNKQVTLMVPFTRSVMETAMALEAEHDTVIVEHEIGVVARKNVPGAADVADISIAAAVETTTIQDMKHWKYQGRVRPFDWDRVRDTKSLPPMLDIVVPVTDFNEYRPVEGYCRGRFLMRYHKSRLSELLTQMHAGEMEVAEMEGSAAPRSIPAFHPQEARMMTFGGCPGGTKGCCGGVRVVLIDNLMAKDEDGENFFPFDIPFEWTCPICKTSGEGPVAAEDRAAADALSAEASSSPSSPSPSSSSSPSSSPSSTITDVDAKAAAKKAKEAARKKAQKKAKKERKAEGASSE